MNQRRESGASAIAPDPKITSDWAAVLKRLADLERRSGGDTRRRAILARIGGPRSLGSP